LAYQKLGLAHQRLGEMKEARDYRARALKGFKALEAAHPTDVQIKVDMAGANGNCGALEMQIKDFARAAPYFERAVAILQDLESKGKLKNQPVFQNWLREQQRKLPVCQKAARAVEDLDFALAQPAAEVPELLLLRSAALAGRGRHAPAALTAEKLRSVAPRDAAILYNVACCYGLCVAGVAAGKTPDQLTAAESVDRAKYLRRAIDTLREAVRRGYKDVQHLQTDPDLAALRSEQEYQTLVASLTSLK
jgi:tetratricopeptide (TPR) repeat protein